MLEHVQIVQTVKSPKSVNVPKKSKMNVLPSQHAAGLNGVIGPTVMLTALMENEPDLDFVIVVINQLAQHKNKTVQARI